MIKEQSILTKEELIAALAGIISLTTCFNRETHLMDFLYSQGIEISGKGGEKISNCYNLQSYEIISNEVLDKDIVQYLFDIGLIGCGQEFWQSKSSIINGKNCITTVSRVDSSD